MAAIFPSTSCSRIIRAAVAYTAGAACLFWVFHRLPLADFGRALVSVNLPLTAAAGALSLTAYFSVAWEWQLLLRPKGRISFWKSAQAVFTGRFVNDVLPMHVGYLARAFLAARSTNIGVADTAPSLMMERLWDGFWLAAGTAALAFFAPLPPEVAHARNALAAMVLGGVVVAGIVVVWPRKPGPGSDAGGAAPVRRFVVNAADGMRDIARSHVFGMVMALSLVKLAIQAASILVMLRACGISLPLASALVVFVAGYISTSIPATPAGAGVYQLAVVGVLGFFGVEKAEAAGFSVISFAAVAIPPAVAGFFALMRSGISLQQIGAKWSN